MMNNEFRYSHVLTTANKIKKSESVYLSKAGQSDFYKIAFVHNNEEFLAFELTHHISLSNNRFVPLNGQHPEELVPNKFSMLLPKAEARQLLNSLRSERYANGVLDFLNKVLI